MEFMLLTPFAYQAQFFGLFKFNKSVLPFDLKIKRFHIILPSIPNGNTYLYNENKKSNFNECIQVSLL